MKDFKIGDSVRVKDTPNPEWMQKIPPLPDAIFKVEGTQNDKLILSVKDSDAFFICDAKHFELVEYPDPKTSFLEELQSLLRKYNVQIHDGEYYYIGFEIGANRGNSQTIHYSIGDLDEMCITPDNIFNYDKE